jgi:Spy/CpxP family protein refolding chaperone
MVDAYVIANIQESLGLDDGQYTRVIPLVNKLQKTRREYFGERGRALHTMRRLLRSGTATEAEVEEALKAFNALETEGPARIRTQLSALDAVLTPLQQAKYRVFEVEVEQRMRELMRRSRQERSPEDPPTP